MMMMKKKKLETVASLWNLVSLCKTLAPTVSVCTYERGRERERESERKRKKDCMKESVCVCARMI